MGKKWITTIEGLDDDLDLKRIAKAMKRSFHCATVITTNDDKEEVIQLQGDHREHLRDWLVANEVLTDKEAGDRIVIHGA